MVFWPWKRFLAEWQPGVFGALSVLRSSSSVHGATRLGKTLLELNLPAVQESVERVAVAIGELADMGMWPDDVRFHVDLVLEELIQNIVSYGYPERPHGTIHLLITQSKQQLRLFVADDGMPFNPFDLPEPDTESPISERSIGGLGIHFARTFMDRYGYHFEDGRNCVELLKEI